MRSLRDLFPDRRKDLSRDASCLAIACVLHLAVIHQRLLALSWSVPASKPEAALPVEFVKRLPQDPSLAPMPSGRGRPDAVAVHGPGPIERERLKRGAPRPPAARLRAPRARRPGLTAEQAEEVRERRSRRRALARERAERALALAREREARRLVRLREEEERGRRLLAERREAEARRRAALAEQRRIQLRRQADIERQLAVLPDPEEAVAGAGETPSASRPGRGTPVIAKGPAADLAAEAADPVFDPEGREGRDALNAKPSGGGFGEQEGGPVSWQLEGPVGTRRLLRRAVPACPDWVSARGLDLIVQLKFMVLENGSVKEGVLIRKTSGFPELDRVAIEALRRWTFQSLSKDKGARAPETWGVVTFRFMAG